MEQQNRIRPTAGPKHKYTHSLTLIHLHTQEAQITLVLCRISRKHFPLSLSTPSEIHLSPVQETAYDVRVVLNGTRGKPAGQRRRCK